MSKAAEQLLTNYAIAVAANTRAVTPEERHRCAERETIARTALLAAWDAMEQQIRDEQYTNQRMCDTQLLMQEQHAAALRALHSGPAQGIESRTGAIDWQEEYDALVDAIRAQLDPLGVVTMDPPDGGDPTIAERVGNLVEAYKARCDDAAEWELECIEKGEQAKRWAIRNTELEAALSALNAPLAGPDDGPKTEAVEGQIINRYVGDVESDDEIHVQVNGLPEDWPIGTPVTVSVKRVSLIEEDGKQ